jgi:hypothetical protein
MRGYHPEGRAGVQEEMTGMLVLLLEGRMGRIRVLTSHGDHSCQMAEAWLTGDLQTVGRRVQGLVSGQDQ